VKSFYIFNTLTRSVEELTPAHPPELTYYSCGPTVYLPQHLGNLRAYLFVDTFKRALRFNGWTVRHVMNITDVGHMTSDADAGEDKIERTARATGKSPTEIADFYIAQFKHDCARLNIELPEPPLLCRATDHIGDMIALIERIIANGLAYVEPSGVYFDLEKWRGPGGRGRLSRQSLEEQNAGQRLEHSADKRSPHDFALWVLNQPDHLMQWDSPWGRGYPGWHIECSAMSMKYLGTTLDIHSGGLDHIPVHHENEIAQSEGATGQPFVRYFVHNAFLVGMEGAKISKSAGKFPLVDDLIAAGLNPLSFRLLCFGAKYRSELAFSLEAVRGAQTNLEYLFEFVRNLPEAAAASGSDADWAAPFRERFHTALNNDLNTSEALAVVLELVRESYRRHDPLIWNLLRALDEVLGFGLASLRARHVRLDAADIIWSSDSADVEVTGPNNAAASAMADAAASAMAKERQRLRKIKKFAEADTLRKDLFELGYVVEDRPEEPGFRLTRRKPSAP
jgi:cysteinyl-tRNA synthetase